MNTKSEQQQTEIRIGAGGVVIGPEGKIVVVNQKHRSWALPKGGKEPTETLEEAARREIQEESGITKLELIKELGTYERHGISKNNGIDYSKKKKYTFFLYKTTQKTLNPQDKDNPEAIWLTPSKAAEKLTHPKDANFLKQVIISGVIDKNQ